MDKMLLSDLNSGDPERMAVAEEYLKGSQGDLSSPDDLKMIREDLESGDPERITVAMEYQEKLNKDLGRSDLGRHAARTAKSAVKGVAGLADIPNLAALGLYAAGLKKDPSFYKSISGRVGDKIDALTDNYTAPTSKKEKVYDAVIEALSTLPGTQGLGLIAKGAGAAKVGKGLKNVGKLSAENVAGAAGAGAASQIAANELPDSPLAALAAGIAGGVGGAGSINALGRSGNLNKQALRAFKESGVPYGWGDIAKEKGTQAAMGRLPSRFGSQNVMKKHIESQMEGVKSGLGHVAETALKEGKREATAVKGMEEFFGKEKAKHSRRYDKNREAIKQVPNTSVELNHVHEWLDSLHPEARNDLLKGNSKAKKYLNQILSPEKASETIDYSLPLDELMAQVSKASKAEAPLEKARDYHFLERKLRDIGADIKTDKAQKNYKEAELSHLYGLLKNDVDASLGPKIKTHAGENAHKNWESLGDHYKEYSAQDVPHINALLGEATKDSKGRYHAVGKENEINKAMISDIKTGGRGFIRLLSGLESHGERAALSKSILEQLGMRQGEFVPHVMQTNFSKLPHSSQKILLKSLGKEEAKTFEATLDVIKQSKNIQKQSNPSGSAHHIDSDTSSRQAANLAASAVAGATLPTGSVLGLGVLPAIRASKAKVLTSPKIRDWKLASREKGTATKHILRGALQGINSGLIVPSKDKKRSKLKISINASDKERHD